MNSMRWKMDHETTKCRRKKQTNASKIRKAIRKK